MREFLYYRWMLSKHNFQKSANDSIETILYRICNSKINELFTDRQIMSPLFSTEIHTLHRA